jgi:cobalt-precorrin 5A hydrolase
MERDAMSGAGTRSACAGAQPVAVAGIGFRSNATLTSVLDALQRAGADGLHHLALPEAKARTALAAALSQLGYQLIPIAADDLPGVKTLTESAASRAAHGAGSVAEACALLGAGARSRLLAPRSPSFDHMATAAVARQPSDCSETGIAQNNTAAGDNR